MEIKSICYPNASSIYIASLFFNAGVIDVPGLATVRDSAAATGSALRKSPEATAIMYIGVRPRTGDFLKIAQSKVNTIFSINEPSSIHLTLSELSSKVSRMHLVGLYEDPEDGLAKIYSVKIDDHKVVEKKVLAVVEDRLHMAMQIMEDLAEISEEETGIGALYPYIHRASYGGEDRGVDAARAVEDLYSSVLGSINRIVGNEARHAAGIAFMSATEMYLHSCIMTDPLEFTARQIETRLMSHEWVAMYVNALIDVICVHKDVDIDLETDHHLEGLRDTLMRDDPVIDDMNSTSFMSLVSTITLLLVNHPAHPIDDSVDYYDIGGNIVAHFKSGVSRACSYHATMTLGMVELVVHTRLGGRVSITKGKSCTLDFTETCKADNGRSSETSGYYVINRIHDEQDIWLDVVGRLLEENKSQLTTE